MAVERVLDEERRDSTREALKREEPNRLCDSEKSYFKHSGLMLDAENGFDND